MSDIKTLNGHNLVDMAATAKLNSVIETVGGDTLTWDGETEGLTVADFTDTLGAMFYKVCSAAPTAAELETGTAVYDVGATIPLAGGVVDTGEGVVLALDNQCIVVQTDNSSLELDEGVVISFPERGIYFMDGNSLGVPNISSLIIPGYTGFTTEKIKQDALPEGVKVNPTWDDIGSKNVTLFEYENITVTAEGYQIEATFYPNIGDIFKVVFDGTTYKGEVQDMFGQGAYFGNARMLGSDIDTGEPFAIMWMATEGVAGFFVQDTTVTHSIKADCVVATQIPDKYVDQMRLFYLQQGLQTDLQEQIYLCHDMLETRKVTKAELKAALEKGPIVLSTGGASFYAPIFSTIVNNYDYGCVMIMRENGTFERYYTSEYTPPTT